MMLNRRALLASFSLAATPAFAQSTALRVGYVPVIGAAALFVLDRAGWARDAGIAVSTARFDSGPAAIQAFGQGAFDVLAIGVAPVAVARAKGLAAKVVSAGGSGGSAFIATADLAARFDAAKGAPGPALAAFRRETGRRAKLATLPAGAVPAAALHHWLFATGGTDPADVEIAAVGIDAVQRAILAGAIDGGTALEPSATIALTRNPALRMIATSLDMFPQVPGVVIAASEAAIALKRPAVVELVRLVSRATALIRANPDEAAGPVAAALGGGLVEPAVMAQAMRSKAVAFLADPREIVGPTQRLIAYQATMGDFASPPPTEGLFDFTVWDEARRG